VRDLSITLIRGAGAKRGRGCFIDSVIDLVDEFYARVVQDFKAATPMAPKVSKQAADQASGDTVLADLLAEAPRSRGRTKRRVAGRRSAGSQLGRLSLYARGRHSALSQRDSGRCNVVLVEVPSRQTLSY
jgi:hypothetical protein